MARKNNRWSTHQSLGTLVPEGPQHTCEPIPCRTGHICLLCGRPVSLTTR